MQVRFLLPVLPVFNISAAAALGRIWNNRHKPAWSLACAACAVLMAATVLASSVMLLVSRQNYPGGHALHQLHSIETTSVEVDVKVPVHIDVLAAMTGVSRFGELGLPWRYSKVIAEPQPIFCTFNSVGCLSLAMKACQHLSSSSNKLRHSVLYSVLCAASMLSHCWLLYLSAEILTKASKAACCHQVQL